jgi:uncharacterized protein with PIN domain
MPYTASFRFHASLNDFLAPGRQGQCIQYQFDNHPAIKDSIEALGAPHPEVAAILVNGEPVDFKYQLQDNDAAEVYPIDAVPAQAMHSLLIPPYAGEPLFILDVHLGALARYLRLLGLDCLYHNHDWGDEHIARLAAREQRIVLSRDVGLLKRSNIERGLWLRHTAPRAQVREVIQRYQLVKWFKPFTRCSHCNGLVEAVDKASLKGRLPVRIYNSFDEFRQCSHCGHVYWRGSHYDKMQRFITELSR